MLSDALTDQAGAHAGKHVAHAAARHAGMTGGVEFDR